MLVIRMNNDEMNNDANPRGNDPTPKSYLMHPWQKQRAKTS